MLINGFPICWTLEARSYALSATRIPSRLSRSFVRGALHLMAVSGIGAPSAERSPRRSGWPVCPGEEVCSAGTPPRRAAEAAGPT